MVRFEIIFPDGTLNCLTKGETPFFSHYIVNFGGLGVITSMTMKLEPRFMLQK